MECEQNRTWSWELTQANGVSHALPRGLIFIGCEGCDIILQSPGIEKRHAVISYNADHGEFFIKDLNSLIGTFVNGTRISEQLYIKLNPEDSVRLGYGPIFRLTQAGHSPSHLKEQPDFHKVEETCLHDSLEDICDLPLHSEEKPIAPSVPSPLVTNNSHEMLKDVGSPTKVMHFPSSPIKSPPVEKGTFVDIAIINRSQVRSPHKDESLSEKNNSTTMSEASSPPEGQSGSTGGSRTPENSQPAAMAFTIPFDLEMPKKKIRARESLSRFTSSKSDSENGHSYRSPLLSSRKDDRQLSEKVNGASRGKHDNLHAFNVVLQKYSKISLQELPTPPNSNYNGSQLNDSASYLIHKMLDGESGEDAYGVPKQNVLHNRKFSLERRKPSPTSSGGDKHSPEYSLPHSPSSPVKLASRERDADEKSETGTYTVEMEQNDPDVEEARKKIDEVFGVYKPSDKVTPRQSSKESNGVPFSQYKSHNGSDMSDRDSGSSREPAPVARPKRRLPTPPTEKVNLNFEVVPARENSYPTVCLKGKRGDTFIQDYPASSKPPLPSNTCVLSHSSVPKPPPRFYSSKSHIEQRGEPLYPRTDKRLVHRQSSGGSQPESGTLSDGGCNRQFLGSPWRRLSWNRSCSDLELDQSKSDSASVVSDLSTSTEPSSHSSGRNAIKNEVGPQMRLNRAFALRRARLGFETDDLPTSVRMANKQSSRPPGDHSSNSSPNSLSRQDGGRFSLRLPRSTTVRLSKVNKPQETKVVRQPHAWAAPKPAEAKDPSGITDEHGTSHKAKREVSALDSLVISAIYQLSVKLKVGASTLLERERQKHSQSSDSRLMIDELLPQMGDKKPSEMSAEGNLTRDLSSILRNLKRVEQVVEVMTVLGEQTGASKDSQRREKGGFFIVDV